MAIGVDVGGTKVRTAAVSRTGEVLARRHRPTSDTKTADALLAGIAEDVADVRREAFVDGRSDLPVGLALPGPLDRTRGCVLRSINVPFLEELPIVGMVEDRIGAAPTLCTDGAAATWGEYTTCRPQPKQFVHLRLGTGVACGVDIDGELQRLDQRRDRHMRLLVVDESPAAIECRCGLRGCLETIASGAALDERARQLGYTDGVLGLELAAQRGEEAAIDFVRQAAKAIARAVDNLCRELHAPVVVLGGGVVARLTGLVDQMTRRHTTSGANAPELRPASVQRARLGEDAGVIGAALLALPRASSRKPDQHRA